jgi:prephenate dehydrogenase
VIKRLAIVGVGLIGGSVALALRRAGAVERVVGAGRSRASLERALALKVIDEIAQDPAAAAQGADLVLLALPVGAIPRGLEEIAPHLAGDVVVTDAGSTKGELVASARRILGTAVSRFVPGHPIAGAEKSGVEAARADLFRGRDVILTPLPENPEEQVKRVADLWQACGAHVDYMDDQRHDRVFAAVSHLPHLAAFSLVEELAGRPEREDFFHYAGSGFRDFTRIAASHPEMWRDIALANREAILAELDAYITNLQAVRNMIQTGAGAALEAHFARAKQARENWVKHRQP